MPRLAWIMVNYNGGDEILLTVESVRKDMGQDDLIVLVDNGCSDSSTEQIEETYEDIHVLRNSQNLTFSDACNRGIQYAMKLSYDFIGLINPDVRIYPGTVEKLLSRLKDESIGAASPVITDASGEKLWFAGGLVSWPFAFAWNRGSGKALKSANEFDGSTDYLSGCCWISPIGVWKAVGSMDGRFGMYSEDVDWSWRARRSGYDLHVVGDSLLLHNISTSSGGSYSLMKMRYRALANRLFFRKHSGRWMRILQFLLRFVPVLAYTLFVMLKGESAPAKMYLKSNLERLDERLEWPPVIP